MSNINQNKIKEITQTRQSLEFFPNLIPLIKHTTKDFFSNFSSYLFSECISIFKNKTGDIIRPLNQSLLHSKIYVNTNKVLLKIPEIMMKIVDLDLETAEELLNNLPALDKICSEEESKILDKEFYELISNLLEAFKDYLCIMKNFTSFLRQLKNLTFNEPNTKNNINNSHNNSNIANTGNNSKKYNNNNTNSVNLTSNNNNNNTNINANANPYNNSTNISINVINSNLVILNSNNSTYNLICLESNNIYSNYDEKLKSTYNTVKNLLQQCDNLYVFSQGIDSLTHTCFFLIIGTIFDLINFIDCMLEAFRNISILNYSYSLSLILKGMKLLDKINKPGFNKSPLFKFFLLLFSENKFKFHFLLNFYTTKKKANIEYLLSIFDGNSSNSSSINIGSSNNINTNNTNKNSLKNSVINVRKSVISDITNNNLYNENNNTALEFKDNFRKEIMIIENIKYIDYLKQKLLNFEIVYFKIFFEKKNFTNSIQFDSLDGLSKQFYSNFGDKDLICISNVLDSINNSIDKLGEDENFICTSKSENNKYSSFRIKNNGYFYYFEVIGSFMFACIKFKDKHENYTAGLKIVLSSLSEKLANIHVWESLNNYCINNGK